MTIAHAAQRRPQPGDLAPDVTLRSTSGESVRLADFHGKKHVLVAFFPLAFTSVCTAELCAFSEDFDQFASEDVVVLPISVDSEATLKEFKRKHDMKTDLLSDFKREASRAFGVLNEERFHSERAYFLIDKAGLVRWAHVEQHGGFRRENEEILERIRRLG
jgi:peroxiredoxin